MVRFFVVLILLLLCGSTAPPPYAQTSAQPLQGSLASEPPAATAAPTAVPTLQGAT
jgi:hypothetical protein